MGLELKWGTTSLDDMGIGDDGVYLLVSMKEPTRDMLVECEKMGSADWPSRHQYPRLQIRTVKELLEDPGRPFDVPDSYRIIPQKGVGQIDRDTQTDLGL